MPCFHDVGDNSFAPISQRERRFVEAIVARAPDALSPILTQLDDARACDDGTGWLILRGSRGKPCIWPEGIPFDVVDGGQLGPQGCYNIMLWFNGEGQLQAVELLTLDTGRLNLEALTAWLNG